MDFLEDCGVIEKIEMREEQVEIPTKKPKKKKPVATEGDNKGAAASNANAAKAEEEKPPTRLENVAYVKVKDAESM